MPNNNQMPNLSDLSKMDFKGMLEFIQKNPEIIKSLSPMLANMLGKEGQDPEVMAKAMKKSLRQSERNKEQCI